MSDFLRKATFESCYVPPCIMPDQNISLLWKSPQARPSEEIEEKMGVCGCCLVRLECLADAINTGLSVEHEQDVDCHGVIAGVKDSDLLPFVKGLRNKGVRAISMDDVEEIAVRLG